LTGRLTSAWDDLLREFDAIFPILGFWKRGAFAESRSGKRPSCRDPLADHTARGFSSSTMAASEPPRARLLCGYFARSDCRFPERYGARSSSALCSLFARPSIDSPPPQLSSRACAPGRAGQERRSPVPRPRQGPPSRPARPQRAGLAASRQDAGRGATQGAEPAPRGEPQDGGETLGPQPLPLPRPRPLQGRVLRGLGARPRPLVADRPGDPATSARSPARAPLPEQGLPGPRQPPRGRVCLSVPRRGERRRLLP
jgi:hypothetical protein